MSLSDWERNGWLIKHQTSRNEIRDLLQVVERDVVDSAARGLSADWRMNMPTTRPFRLRPRRWRRLATERRGTLITTE